MNRVVRLAALLVFTLLALPCLAADQAQILTPQQAHSLLQSPPADLVILDVRTDKEYAAGHLPKAVNLDFFGPRFEQGLRALDKSKSYLVYCRTENRSRSAVEMMQQEGFTRLMVLMGGFAQWSRETLPAER